MGKGYPERLIGYAWALCALWLALFAAVPAHAHGETSLAAPTCQATSDAGVSFGANALERLDWRCDGAGWRSDRPVVWLRFDFAQTAVAKDNGAESETAEALRHFTTRNSRHQSIHLAAVDKDGTMRVKRWQESDAKAIPSGPFFRLDLPQVTPDTRTIIARIEGPHSVPLLTEARLSANIEDVGWSRTEMIVLAVVVGMLVLPFLFDLSFFVVLRERFVLLHAIMVIFMIGYVLFAGGLISVFVQLDLAFLAIAGPLCWAVGVGISALFLADFLETGALSPLMKRITIATGIWTIIVPGFFALQLDWTQGFDDPAYFYSFLPALFVITAAIVAALRRGSRDARFVAVAWLPIIAASAERLFRGLGFYVGPSSLDQMLYVATGLEVVIISLGVADRFFAIRRQRDEAVREAHMLERLTERDPLTGLMNRRAIDARFGDLHRAGYETFALIDLDHFKRVNDTAGHAAGDQVLKVIAEVFREDDDSLAMRLGGEEFLLLMRGFKTQERAEKLRGAIPLRVAQNVPELEHLVTASMGLLVVPRKAMPKAEFSDIYSRADRLLYDAKEQGRNRTVAEKLQAFERRRTTDRRAGQRKRSPRSRGAA